MTKMEGDIVSNRRARFEFEILETYEAGICLTGTEIKSLRANGGSLQEAYVRPIGRELWLIGASIAPYKFGSIYNHEEKRDRKLLMHKREIATLSRATREKGMTLVPLALYLVRGRVKIRIGLAKGKSSGDKRQAIKERDDKRQIQRAMRQGQ